MPAQAEIKRILDEEAGRWSVPGAVTTIIADAEPADNGIVVSSEIDNTPVASKPTSSYAGGLIYAMFELQAQFAVSPTGYFSLYLVPAIDGSNYGDGADGSVTPPDCCWVGDFPLRSVMTAQRVAPVAGAALPPCKFKAVLINKSGQAASTNSVQLRMRTFYLR